MNDYERGPTKLPTHIEQEDPFLKMAEIDLSLRKVMTIILSAFIWYFCCMVTKMIFGFFVIIPDFVFYIMFSWIIFGGFFLALKNKDITGSGIKITYEEYLTKKILFKTKPTEYIVKDKTTESIEDADWSEVDDDFAGWGAR